METEPSKAYNPKGVEDKIYRLQEKRGFFNLNFLKKIPIEAYVLIIIPLLGSVWYLIFYPATLSFKTILFYLIIGGDQSIYMIALIIQLHFLYRIIFPVAEILIIKKKDSAKNSFLEVKNASKNYFYFLLLFSFNCIFANLSLNNLSIKSAPERIMQSSNLLINYDYLIFGRDLLFWLNDFVNNNKIWGAALSWVFVGSYRSLGMVLGVLSLILFLRNKDLAKKFLIFFFLIIYISTPIWYFAPVLNPVNMYINNILKIAPPERIAIQMKNYQPAPVLSSYQKILLDSYNKTGGYLNLTAFPSMHAGWGLGIVLYGFMLYWPSIFILLPWFLLQAAGAIYIGQHYLLDIFLGMIMAVITYFLVELLFILEKRYYKGRGSLFIIDAIQEDFKKILIFFKNTYNLWR